MGTHSRPVLPGPQALTEGNIVGKSNPPRWLPGREKEEDEMALSMRRIFSVLAVTALMVAMLVASAMPAFADPNTSTTPNCRSGQDTAAANTGDKFAKHFFRSLFECESHK